MEELATTISNKYINVFENQVDKTFLVVLKKGAILQQTLRLA